MKQLFYIALLIILSGLLHSCSKNRVDWRPVYESQFKSPYGTHVFRNELKNLFPDHNIIDITNKTIKTIDSIKYFNKTSLFLYINTANYIDSNLFEKLISLSKNNVVFISSSNFDVVKDWYPQFDFSYRVLKPLETEALLTLSNDSSNLYHFKDTIPQLIGYFDSIPSNVTVHGYIGKKDSTLTANFISFNPTYTIDDTLYQAYGYMFLHTCPYFFTNYSLLDKGTPPYAFDVMSFMPQNEFFEIYWDGYRTRRRYLEAPSDGDTNSILRFIFQNKSLSFGFGLLFVSLIAYFLFNMKRKHAVLPLHESLKNKSLEFAKTITSLFISHKNKKDLAAIKCNYLLDKIKSSYYIYSEQLDDDFAQKLSLKSGVEVMEVSSLLNEIQNVRANDFISESQFFNLNKQIELFLIKSKIYDR